MSQRDPDSVVWRSVDARTATPGYRFTYGESITRHVALWIIQRAFRVDPLTGEEVEYPELGIRIVPGTADLERDYDYGPYVITVTPAHLEAPADRSGEVIGILDPSDPERPDAAERGGE